MLCGGQKRARPPAERCTQSPGTSYDRSRVILRPAARFAEKRRLMCGDQQKVSGRVVILKDGQPESARSLLSRWSAGRRVVAPLMLDARIREVRAARSF